MKLAFAILALRFATCAFAGDSIVASHPQRDLILKSFQSLVDAHAKAEENHFFIRRVDGIDWIFWREGRCLLSTTFEPFVGDSEMTAEDAWQLRIRYCREQIDLDTALVERMDRPRNVLTREFAARVVYECALNGELVAVQKKPNKAPEPTTLRVTPPAGAGVAPRRVVAHL